MDGELDLFADELARTAISEAWATGTTCLVLDLSAVTFLASSSVSTLLAAQATAEAHGSQLLLRLGESARRTLEVCGVLARFAYMR